MEEIPTRLQSARITLISIVGDSDEAIYINTHDDLDGNTLNGANQYTMIFRPVYGIGSLATFWMIDRTIAFFP